MEKLTIKRSIIIPKTLSDDVKIFAIREGKSFDHLVTSALQDLLAKGASKVAKVTRGKNFRKGEAI